MSIFNRSKSCPSSAMLTRATRPLASPKFFPYSPYVPHTTKDAFLAIQTNLSLTTPPSLTWLKRPYLMWLRRLHKFIRCGPLRYYSLQNIYVSFAHSEHYRKEGKTKPDYRRMSVMFISCCSSRLSNLQARGY